MKHRAFKTLLARVGQAGEILIPLPVVDPPAFMLIVFVKNYIVCSV